ncbi:MAG: transcription repressor NadR [Trueperella sp.]|nr:transcription repressor NadR [Trueperella sp.]
MSTPSGEERQAVILETLENASTPIAASRFAEQFGVSRQVIVQDIALLRASGHQILSTNRGYLIEHQPNSAAAVRVFKCRHTAAQMRAELQAMVDNGATVANVFISHRAYGTVQAKLNLHSRADVDSFLEKMASGASQPLMVATDGYHYHTVLADSEEILDAVEHDLGQLGFLAPLREYELEDIRGIGQPATPADLDKTNPHNVRNGN